MCSHSQCACPLQPTHTRRWLLQVEEKCRELYLNWGTTLAGLVVRGVVWCAFPAAQP